MIELKKLAAENFLSWRRLDFDFEAIDLCLLVGDNGSGKSSIPSAVTWALYGKTQKGLQADDVINWDVGKNCFVQLTMMVNDTECEIIRYRKWSALSDPNHLYLRIGGEQIEGTNTEKQKAIIELVGADFQTFISTSFFSQGKIKFLGEATDTDRKELFKRILDLSRFDKAYKVADSRIKKEEEELRDIEHSIFSNEHQMELLEERLELVKKLWKQFDNDKSDKISDLEERLKVILDRQAEQIDGQDKMLRLEELDKILEDREALGKEYSKHSDVVWFGEREIEEILDDKINSKRKELKEVDAGVCPTCNQPLPDGDLKDRILKDLNRLEGQKAKLVEDVRIAEAKIAKLEPKMREIDKQGYTDEYFGLKAEIKSARRQTNLDEIEARRLYDRLEEVKESQNEYPKEAGRIKTEMLEIESSLTQLSMAKDKASKRIVVLGQVKEVFSKRGAISYIMENYFKFLTAKANYYMSRLDTDITIDIKAQKETKGGDKREEISIEIQKGGHNAVYENLSDGQRQKLNIVLLFAVHSLCRSINVSGFDTLFLDEVLDLSLDSDGKEFVFELLRLLKLEEDIAHVLVISHAEEIKNSFKEIVYIKMTETGSKNSVPYTWDMREVVYE